MVATDDLRLVSIRSLQLGLCQTYQGRVSRGDLGDRGGDRARSCRQTPVIVCPARSRDLSLLHFEVPNLKSR